MAMGILLSSTCHSVMVDSDILGMLARGWRNLWRKGIVMLTVVEPDMDESLVTLHMVRGHCQVILGR